MYKYDSEEECGCKDIMATPLSSLAFHYKVARQIDEMYNPPIKLNTYLLTVIEALVNNRMPDYVTCAYAGLINQQFDRYNPIFTCDDKQQ